MILDAMLISGSESGGAERGRIDLRECRSGWGILEVIFGGQVGGNSGLISGVF